MPRGPRSCADEPAAVLLSCDLIVKRREPAQKPFQYGLFTLVPF